MDDLVTATGNESVMSYSTVTETQPPPFLEVMRISIGGQVKRFIKMALACPMAKPHGSEGVCQFASGVPHSSLRKSSTVLETSSSFLADRSHTMFLWNAKREVKGNWRGMAPLV